MAISIVTFALAVASSLAWYGMVWHGVVWYGIVASSLADLKASSHSLQTQQNIDLNPKETIPFETPCPKILEIAKMLLKSSQSCGFDFWPKMFFGFLSICRKLRFASDALQQ